MSITSNVAFTRMRGELKLKDGAGNDTDKTAPVRLVARSGDPINHPFWGNIVHDFAGMKLAKGKIPLDFAHDDYDSIGYLNNFDTASGDLVCSGAIVNVEQGSAVIAKLREGVPYEASIEFGDDYLLEELAAGMIATVNGREVVGPCFIVRQWTLVAVAVCKFGADSNTSTELQFSKNRAKGTKGYFVRLSKEKGMQMENTDKDNAGIVEIVAEQKAQADGVEATAEIVEPVTLSKVEGVSEAKAVEAVAVADPVEAKPVEKPAEQVAEVTADKPTELATPLATDPRAEARRFIERFGEVHGVKYFAAGKSYDDAISEHLTFQANQINELSTRLAAIDRGSATPVAFKDAEQSADAMANNFIRLAHKPQGRKN